MSTDPGMPVPGPGRPRDAQVDRKALRAALALYAELGWAKFTLDAVARRAGIGKAALYRRWPSREKLIADAIESALVVPSFDIDTGTLRQDLRELIGSMLAHYLGPYGLAGLRLHVEARAYPELFSPVTGVIRKSRVLEARQMIRRAIARGELGPEASPTLILDTLLGAVLQHVLATPEELREDMRAQAPAYADRLIDFVLTAATTLYPPD
ncbi:MULTISPECIES: TetR/AcrR family transcriptional regulator [Herbidospora]|nr:MULTISPECIES: TetR/AcrR family transcriptional regulator [Herbidospora]GLX93367.1 TetR family transcriptional regulator [Herbidospora sp. NBRC 101105]